MLILTQIADKIIKEQELIIGPMAWDEAIKVPGLKVDKISKQVEVIAEDDKGAIDQLVARYERLFGRASHEVCREAVMSITADLLQGDLPLSLRS